VLKVSLVSSSPLSYPQLRTFAVLTPLASSFFKAGLRKHDRAEMAYIEFVDNGLPPLRFTKAELGASVMSSLSDHVTPPNPQPQPSFSSLPAL
jgi:hypothetical protein